MATCDAGSWSSDADMYDDVALALSFPDYFGRNLEALNDCMSDVASADTNAAGAAAPPAPPPGSAG